VLRSMLDTSFAKSSSVEDFLHIAMQIGLYHPRPADHGLSQLGVQSLRILPVATNLPGSPIRP
jgi:hypothetical protein